MVRALDQAGIDYMVTGSLAGSYHGVPRSTQDVDLVIDGTPHGIVEWARGLLAAGFYVSEDAARAAVATRGQFNVIDPSGGWKVDLIVRRDRPFSRTEFARRLREDAFGFPLWMATAEDVVLAKLEWARLGESERQRQDAVGILRSQAGRLDEDYIGRWAEELGLSSEWDRARERAARKP